MKLIIDVHEPRVIRILIEDHDKPASAASRRVSGRVAIVRRGTTEHIIPALAQALKRIGGVQKITELKVLPGASFSASRAATVVVNALAYVRGLPLLQAQYSAAPNIGGSA